MRKQHSMWQFAVVAAVLGVWASHADAQVPANNPLAARVNGEPITQAELQALLDLRPSPVPVTKELQREMRKAALDMLVDDMIMRQFLRKAVAPLNPADVQKEYDKLNEALAKQKKTLAQFLQEGKITAEQLQADIIARLQWKAFLDKTYSDTDAKSYYDANKVFFDNVVVRASHILVKLTATATVDEKQKAKAKLDTLRLEILAGKLTFEDAARRYSECTLSKDKGGDIGHFPYKFVVVEPFARAAYGAKKGDVTDVVATEFGYHLIKVTDRTDGEPSRFAEIREQVRDVMSQDAELYQRILIEQKKAAKIENFVQ